MKRWGFVALACVVSAVSFAAAKPFCFAEALKTRKVKLKLSPEEGESSGQYFKVVTSDGAPGKFERPQGAKGSPRVIPAEDLIRGADMLHNPIVYRAIARAFKTSHFDPKQPQKSIRKAIETYARLKDAKQKNVHLENIYALLDAELNDKTLENLVIRQDAAEAVRLDEAVYTAFADIVQPLLRDKDVAKLLIDEMISDGAGLARHVADYAQPRRKPLDAAAIRRQAAKTAKRGGRWASEVMKMAVGAGVMASVMQGYFSPMIQPMVHDIKNFGQTVIAADTQVMGHRLWKESPESIVTRTPELKRIPGQGPYPGGAWDEFEGRMRDGDDKEWIERRLDQEWKEFNEKRFAESSKQKREYPTAKLPSEGAFRAHMSKFLLERLRQMHGTFEPGLPKPPEWNRLANLLESLKPGMEVRVGGTHARIIEFRDEGWVKLQFPGEKYAGEDAPDWQIEEVILLDHSQKTIGEWASEGF